MPSNASFTIKDGAATPQDHVFSPQLINADGVASFVERTGNTMIGQNELTYSVRRVGGNGTYKVTLQLKKPKPVVATGSNGVQQTLVDYQDLGKVELVVSQKGTLQERKDLRVLLANALQHATFVQAIDNVESFW